ncbi:MAG: heme-binding protein [Pseudomonas rhizophila]|uniref:heme-binding protein n=1 Tax=Pseudomonas rhizophila TaxID=2045200 RepID=UPI003F6C96A8
MDTLNFLVNNAQPLSSTLSADGQLVSLSAKLSDQLGYAPEQLLNQPIERIYSVESVRALQLLFANPPADEQVHSLELTLIRHNGGLLRHAFLSAPLLTSLEGGVPIIVDDQVIGAVGVSEVKAEQDAQVAKARAQCLK